MGGSVVLQLIYGIIILLASVVGLLAFALAFGFFHTMLERRRRADILPIEQLPDGVMIFDASGRIVAVNPTLLGLLSCERHTLLNQTRAQLLETYPALKAVLDRDRPLHKPIMLHYRAIEISQHSHHTNGVDGALWIFRDVSERIATERILRVSEQRYRALFENSNDAVFIINMDRRIELANQRASEMLGVPLDDLLGADTSLYTLASENVNTEERFQALMAGDRIPVYERTFINAQGQHIPCEVTLLLVRDGDGAPLHIQTIVRDITERKRTEEELNARLDQLDIMHRMDEEISSTLSMDSVAMIGLDAALRLSRANAGFIAVVEEEEVRVRHFIGAYPDDADSWVLRHDVGIAGRILINQEPELVRDVTQDPDYYKDIEGIRATMGLPLISQEHLVGVVILETKYPDYFTEQRFKFMQVLASRIAIAIDNARLYDYARGQLEELQSLYEELKALESIKTDMIRIASHDLKNPLSIISGYIQLMRLDAADLLPEHLEYLKDMDKSISRMQNILNDILSLERIKEQTSFDMLNLTGLVKRAVEEYEPQAQQKNQAFSVTLPDESVVVEGNEAQLYEAVANLIGNAIKYTPDDGEVCVTLTHTGRQAHFSVKDTGYGIPADRHERLFQPFYRAKTTGTEHIEGTGLGLHLVKNVIERHSGIMHFESEEGQGSTFGFTLPTLSQTP